MSPDLTLLTPQGKFGTQKEPSSLVLFSQQIAEEFRKIKDSPTEKGKYFFEAEIFNFFDIERELLNLESYNPDKLWVPILRLSLLEDPRFFLLFLKKWLRVSSQREVILIGEVSRKIDVFLRWESTAELQKFLESSGFKVVENKFGLSMSYDIAHINEVFSSKGLPKEDLQEIFFFGDKPPEAESGDRNKFFESFKKRAFVCLGHEACEYDFSNFRFGDQINLRDFFSKSTLAGMDQASRAFEIQIVLSLLYPDLEALWSYDFGAALVRVAQGRMTGLVSSKLKIKLKCLGTHLLLEKSKKEWLPLELLPVIYSERYLIQKADLLVFQNKNQKHQYKDLSYEFDESKVLFQYEQTETFLDTSVLITNPEKPTPHLTTGIIIPCFKMETRFLEDLIKGLNNQVWKPEQIVVVDDGSDPAETGKYQQLFASVLKLPFQYLKLENNIGLAGARNEALKILSTDIVINLDADDVPLRDFVKSLQQVFEENPSISAVSSYSVQFEDGVDWTNGKNLRSLHKPLGDGLVWGLYENPFGHANSAFRREVLNILGGWDSETKAMWEDWELFLKLRSQNFEIAVIPRHNFLYRQRATSMSKTYNLFEGHERLSRAGIIFSQFDQHRLRQLIVNLIFFKGEFNRPGSKLTRRIIQFIKRKTPFLFKVLKLIVNGKT